MSGKHYKVEVTSPDGKKITARGFVRISIERALIDITNNGILGGRVDFAKRYAAGPVSLRIDMNVSGEVVETIPPLRKRKRGKR